VTSPTLISTDSLDDTLQGESTIEVFGTTDIVVVIPPVDTIELDTDVLTGLGPKGEPGESPPVSKYLEANAYVTDGSVVIDATQGSTFWLNLDQNVSSFSVVNWPSDRAQRIHIYSRQDGIGGRVYAANAFPSGMLWSYGERPIETTPGGLESFVIEHLPNGNTLYGAVVGRDYR
jgi:hypothetical protein